MAGVHGNGTEPGAGYVAVAESWADHIGELFSGLTNKQMDAFYLENGYIPRGIYWDLHDVVNKNENFLVSDNIGGFTNAMIFNELNSKRIEELKNRLWNHYGNNNSIIGSQSDYNDLFISYGY